MTGFTISNISDSVTSFLYRLKLGFVANLNRTLGEPHSALAAGLVVGEKSALGKDLLDDLDKTLKDNLMDQNIYPMFSREHIQAIVDLVNKDEFIKRKGEELDLTLQLAIKLDNSGQGYKFTFEKGSIIKLEPDDNAPFVISAPAEVWELVFLGKLDSFVAVTQGKMKLKGELGKLSRWYVPFSRLFELFRQIRIK